jgi:hypothetical protein
MSERLIDVALVNSITALGKEQVKTNEYLLCLILQMMEMNEINRQVLQISGGAPVTTKKNMDKEVEFLNQHVEQYCGEAKKIVKLASLIYKENKNQ